MRVNLSCDDAEAKQIMEVAAYLSRQMCGVKVGITRAAKSCMLLGIEQLLKGGGWTTPNKSELQTATVDAKIAKMKTGKKKI